MPRKERSPLDQIIKSEKDPYTKKLLRTIKNWWRPPNFDVPDENPYYISGGYYGRVELFPILTAGYKPGMDDETREELVQISRAVFRFMLLCDDGDPTFENTHKNSVDKID